VLGVAGGHPWWTSHAQLPTVLPLADDRWRVYFGARDADNRTRILAVDVDPTQRMTVVAEHFEPLLDRGPLGAFDHEGVCPSSAVIVDGVVRLYYVGVAVRQDVRGCTAIGLAESGDGLAFRRRFAGPVFGTGPLDPFFTTAPAVQRGPDGYRMWYVSGTGWTVIDGVPDPEYAIRRTVSTDGLQWDPRSRTALALERLGAAGLGRPWVAELRGAARLWFSRRGPAYRLPGRDAYRLLSAPLDARGEPAGPAEAVEFDTPPAAGDFDSWMQAYACVLPHGDDLVMLYNGDGFGRDGFGWARLPGGARRG